MGDELKLKRQQDLIQIQAQTLDTVQLNEWDYEAKYDYTSLSYQKITEQMRGSTGAAHLRATGVKKNGYFDRKRQKEAEEKMRVARTEDEEANMNRQTYVDNMIGLDITKEKKVLETKLEAIRAQRKVALGSIPGKFEYQRLNVRVMAAADIAEAYARYARMLPLESEERAKAMEEKEKAQIEYSKLKKQLSIMNMTGEEKKQEEKTQTKHYWYDVSKSICRDFRGVNPLSREDATFVHPVTGHKLLNVGRAFFGGTKPMYIFEDREQPILVNGQTTFKRYLFKEPINCMGGSTPERAEVTTAAAVLQEKICGTFHVPTFIAKDDHGKILGTFQEQVSTLERSAPAQKADEPEYGKVDLFSWQKNPVTDLPKVVTDQVLREHVLDWLLCNFDTKGENFLQRDDYRLCSIDKEASFRKILSDDAQHMDEHYCPHNNETIYNVIFRMYAAGQMTLDLDAMEEHIEKMETAQGGMSDEEFMGLFKDYLDKRFGPTGKDRAKAEANMLARKQGLRAEYKAFLGRLTQQRLDATKDETERAKLQERLSPTGEYLFKSERPA